MAFTEKNLTREEMEEMEELKKYTVDFMNFEKKIKQTYTNKPTTTILCPTCNIPMLQCQYYGGGVFWLCGKCSCKVERTGC